MNQKPTIETNVVKPKMFFINDSKEYRMITESDETNLDKIIAAIVNYIKENDGKNQPEDYKDLLYTNSKKMWEDYAVILRNVKFSMYFNKQQFEFLTNLLLEEMEYDVNTVFYAIELTDMLGEWSKEEDFDNTETLKTFTADATEVTYLYHLISKHKVKGLTNDSYRFAEILKKIGDVSKIIGYYDNAAKSLAKEIQDWVANFDPQPSGGSISATTIKPN